MKTYSAVFEGHDLTVEFDQSMVFWYRVRLIVDGEVADERSVWWGRTLLRAAQPRPLLVDAAVGFFGPRRVVLQGKSGPMSFQKDAVRSRR